MRTCKKWSHTCRSNTRHDALLRGVSCAETWKVNRERGEGFSDSFSYFGNTLQQDKRGWREKQLTNTVTEHRVHSTNLTHGPSIWVDNGGSFCKKSKTLHSKCQASERETSSSFARQPRFALIHRVIRLQQTEWSECSLFSSTLQS